MNEDFERDHMKDIVFLKETEMDILKEINRQEAKIFIIKETPKEDELKSNPLPF